MACKKIYYGNDSQPSKLYEALTEYFGIARGEYMYLSSKLPQFETTNLNDQGEASVQAVIDADFKFIPKSKRSVLDIFDNIVGSSSVIKFTADPHEYHIEGEKIKSVSEWTDIHVPYTGSKSNIKYEDKGSRYHLIVQDIVQTDLTNEELESKHSITANEKGFIPYFRNLKKNLEKTGKVIAETKVALAEKGIAGQIDILHVKDSGAVDIYDLKNVFQSAGNPNAEWNVYKRSGKTSNYKAQRYSLQTLLYKHILENSDDVTGRVAVEVDNVFVIPVQVFSEDGETVDSLSTLPAENINSWQAGTINFATYAERQVKSLLGQVEAAPSELQGYTLPSTIKEFMGSMIPNSSQSGEDLTRTAKRIAENPSNEKGFEIRGVFYRWDGNSREKRISKAKSVLASNDDSSSKDLTRAALLTIESKSPNGYFEKSTDGAEQLKKIMRLSHAKSVNSLADIKGFEQYEDVLMLTRPGGSVDLIKLTFDNIRRELPIANKNKNLVHKYVAGVTGSLLGNHLTYGQAKDKGITLQNNIADREKLRLGVIAMELKAANPDLTVDRILVQSFTNTNTLTVPETVNLNEILPQINAIRKLPEIARNITGRLKTILSNESLYDETGYVPNFPLEYLEYLRIQFQNDADFITKDGEKNQRYFNMKALEYYVNGERTKDQLINRLLHGEGRMRDLIAAKHSGESDKEIQEAVLKDAEFIQLSRTVMSLMNHKMYPEQDISEGKLGGITKHLYTPTKTGRKMLDSIFDELRKGIDLIKIKITNYNHEKKAVFNKLVRADPIWKSGLYVGDKSRLSTDTLLGMGQSVFKPLFKKGINADGSTYNIPWLIEEETVEFRKLNGAQQQTIKFLNDQFEKWFREAHPFKDKNGNYTHKWIRGMVPVMVTSPNSSLHKAKSALAEGDVGKAGKAIKNAVTRSFNMLGNFGNFRSIDNPNDKMKVYDYFIQQINSIDGNMASSTLESIGLDDDMNLTDSAKNLNFETDLEEVLDNFMAHNTKKQEMDKKLPLARFYKSIFKYYDDAHFLKQKDTIQLLDNYVNDNVFGQKIGADSEVVKIVNAAVGASSLMLLGLNWKVFTANGMQNTLNSVISSLTNVVTGDKRFPGVRANTKATIEISKALDPVNGIERARLLELLMETYFPEDIGQLKSRRYKTTQKGIVDSQTAFAMDRIVEYGLRTHYLVAQMIADGTFDAHSVKQDTDEFGNTVYRLAYDETLDERFKKEDGKGLKQAIRESLHQNGEVEIAEGQTLEGTELPKAYDWRLRQKYKSYADEMFSSFDKDLKSDSAHYGLSTGFTQFRMWFRDRFEKAVKKEYKNTVVGDYTMVDGGKHIWADSVFKGIYWTLADLGSITEKVIKEKSLKNIKPEDKRNLALAANSLAAWTLLATLIANMFGDEDDLESRTARHVAMRGIQDLTSILTLAPVFGVLDDPFIFASYYMNVVQTLGKAIGYAGDGDFESAGTKALTIMPVVKELI